MERVLYLAVCALIFILLLVVVLRVIGVDL